MVAASGGPAVGATEIFQMIFSGCPASGATSRIARQSVAADAAAFEPLGAGEGLQQRRQPLEALIDRGREAFEPQQRRASPENPSARAAKGGKCAAPETSTGGAHGGAKRLDRLFWRKAGQSEGCGGLARAAAP